MFYIHAKIVLITEKMRTFSFTFNSRSLSSIYRLNLITDKHAMINILSKILNNSHFCVRSFETRSSKSANRYRSPIKHTLFPYLMQAVLYALRTEIFCSDHMTNQIRMTLQIIVYTSEFLFSYINLYSAFSKFTHRSHV